MSSELTDIICQITYIYRISHPTPNNAYFTLHHMEAFCSKKRPHFGKKTHLYKFKKVEITSYVLSDHKAIKLKTDSKEITSKYTNALRLSNSIVNDEWTKEEIIKYFLNKSWN